jgi:hypothetical protein
MSGEEMLLRELLQEADEAVHVPTDLEERVLERAREGRDRADRPSRWLRSWSLNGRLQPVAVAVVVGVLLVGAAFVGGVLSGRASRQPAATPGATAAPADLRVFNAERACQNLRTIECSIALRGEPGKKAGVIVGRVWHGDVVRAECVRSDADQIADESGVTSRRWYRVTVPGARTSGWLPGVRTRNTREIPEC